MFRRSNRKVAEVLGSELSQSDVGRKYPVKRNQIRRRTRQTGQLLRFEQLESRQLLAGLSFESAFAIGDGMNATSAQGGVIIDDSGNSYVSGYFQGVVDFAPTQTLPGNADILTSTGTLRNQFVAKYDAHDQLIWAKGFGGSTPAELINGMALDGDGNVYAVGRFQDTLTIDAFSISSAGADDGFLLKLDSNGNPQWLSGWGTDLFEYGHDVATSTSGEVYAIGRQNVNTTAMGGSTEVRKFDPATGSVVWMKSVASGSYQSMIAVDSEGNVNFASSFADTFDADPGPGQLSISHGDADRATTSTYAIQLDSNGNLNWARGFEMKTPTSLSTVSFALCYGLAVDRDDNLVIVGGHSGRVDYDPSSTSTTELSESHGSFVVKLSSEGEFEWVGGVVGTHRLFHKDLIFDSANNLILAGYIHGYSDTLDFDPGPGTAYVTTINNSSSNFDSYIWSLSEAGEFRSITHLATPNLSSLILGIGIDASGGIQAVGSFAGQIDFDPGPGVYSLNATARSAFMMRLDTNPGVTVNRRIGHVTSESGQTTSFEVSLDSRPTDNVFVPISSSDLSEGTVNVNGLHFTPTNWSIPQLVTVTGVDDSVVDGDMGYSIILGTLISNDPAYSGINPADIAVINLDDDILATKFYVVDDASIDRTFEYAADGTAIENYSLNSGNTRPRGAASTVAGNKVWVVDANKRVYIYNDAGGLLGSWSAGSLASNATVEGIATNGVDVWLVDARQDRVYRYANAANRLSGSQNATSNFKLNKNNLNPKDIVTDGVHLWVVNDSSMDKVFKYTMTGGLVGSWTIGSANSKPTGITIDPSGASQSIWIVDNGTDRVYEYTNSRGRHSGSQSAALSFKLAAGNGNPQGIADPPPPTTGTTSASTTSNSILDFLIPMVDTFETQTQLFGSDDQRATNRLPQKESSSYSFDLASTTPAPTSLLPAVTIARSLIAKSTASNSMQDEAFASFDLLIGDDVLKALVS